MTDADQPEKIVIDHDRALNKLIRSITHSQGNFVLILARCNYASLRSQIIQKIKERCPIAIRELYLSPSVKTLYTTIQAHLGDEQPQALMIAGLECVTAIDQLLVSTNQVREEFRKNFPFPIVLWVDDETLKKSVQLMPDFKNWTGNSIKFEIETESLVEILNQLVENIFQAILDIGGGKFLENAALSPELNSHFFLELESALEDLQAESKCSPQLRADLQLLLGRDADLKGEKARARQNYEQSLEFWQIRSENPTSNDLLHYGCVSFHLGLWWRQAATLHRADYRGQCLQAKAYYQQCLNAFERANRPDLCAKFINILGEVLTRLEQWDELAAIAPTIMQLHETHSEPIRLAYGHALLAELALHQSSWEEAKSYAELALKTNDEPSTSSIDWSAERPQYASFYRLLLAQAQRHLNQVAEAIAQLETAKAQSNPQFDPLLYIRILAVLRSLYYEQGQYLKAFEVKQEQRSIEQQYGIRAFVGAGRLQSRRQVVNPALAVIENRVSQEISASGRSQDVMRLIERIGRTDHKLTVIYGQSGVGKSSLVQAGLLPALKQQAIEARDVLPVLLQVYTDWAKTLGSRYTESLEELRGLSFPVFLDSMSAFVEMLQKSADKNLLTVLIFDQFEEFFFAYRDPVKRRPFFEFLRDCLNIPYVKVILSLREDYLHYLLECNRLTHLDVIDNNILDKRILYYLGNFSPEDAKSVIQSLAESSQFHLERSLIDELVRDLAGELNEVRPIELQVVGAQLQTEQITTLEQYQAHGPKERLVGRFLEEVVKDCGTNNEQFAKIILYLLTDDNNTRPLKTRAELEADLALESERLDLILQILVKSGLVFQVPGFPADRYQLVHDYLVPFVRQQQAAGLVAELEKEKEQRKLTEAKLNQVLKQQLSEARQGLLWKVSLGVIAGGLAIILPVVLISENNTQLKSMSNDAKGLLKSNNNLEALVKSLKAGKQLKQWKAIGIKPDTKMQVITSLQEVVNTIRERNRLEGYNDAVTCLSFSGDGYKVASGTADGTIRIWHQTGKEIKTFKAHEKKITQIGFSPDGSKVISGSEDKIVKVWDLNGVAIATFKPSDSEVTSVSFSPDGKNVASGSKDSTLRIWNLASQQATVLSGHEGEITSVSFSPDGKQVASGSKDKTLKLWDLTGKRLQSFSSDSAVTAVSFSPDGQVIAASTEEYPQFWGRDGFLIGTSSSLYSAVTTFSSDGKKIAAVSGNSNGAGIYMMPWKGRSDDATRFSLAGHKNSVTSTAFSPDLQQSATGSADKTVKLWSLDDRRFTTSFTPYSSSWVTAVKLSPNNELVSVADSDGQAQVWQRDGTQKETLGGFNSKLSFSPDSQTLVSASQSGAIQLWRSDGTLLKTLPGNLVDIAKGQLLVRRDGSKVELVNANGNLISTLGDYRSRDYYSIASSKDGQTFAMRDGDDTIKLWKRNGTPIKTFQVSQNWLRDDRFQMGLSPDGKLLAVADNDNTVKFLKQDGTVIKTLKFQSPTTVHFSPDGEALVIAEGRQDREKTAKIKLWRMDGTLLATLPTEGESGAGSFEAFASDGQTIATKDSKGGLWFRNLDGSLVSSFDKEVIDYTPDFQTLLTLEGRNQIKLWRSDGTPIRTIHAKTERAVVAPGSFAFSPDGQILSIRVAEDTIELWRRDGTFLKTIKGLSDRRIARLQQTDYSNDPSAIYYGNPLPLSFSSNSQILAIRDSENTVQLWKIEEKTATKVSSVLNPKKGENNLIVNVSFLPGSDTVLLSGLNDTLKLWQLGRRNQELQPLKIFQGHGDQITSVSFSPNGQLIASASKDKTVKLWRRDGTVVYTFTKHSGSVNSVSFSPDGELLASASDDKTVKVWQLDGSIVKSFDEHSNGVTSVSFSPQGDLIASGGKDKTLKLWSLKSKDNKPLQSIDEEEDIESVSFSPDGEMIATASAQKVKLWSIRGALLSTFDTLGKQDVSFSADGKSIISANDGSVSVWDFDLDQLLKRGCDWAHDYLQNNPKAENDRLLCDDIVPRK
jgi:WD40 repeat protein